MALQNYARPDLFFNGNYLREVTSLNLTTNSGNQRVDLLTEGLGGFTPGPGDVTIECGFAVPIGGPEEDFFSKTANGDFVTLQFNLGRKYYIGEGKIDTCNVGASTGANTEGSFTWIGELKPMEGGG